MYSCVYKIMFMLVTTRKKKKDYLARRMGVAEIFEKDLTFLKNQEIVKCLYLNPN